jgi:hypothetical protein
MVQNRKINLKIKQKIVLKKLQNMNLGIFISINKFLISHLIRGHIAAQWLRHYATS